MTDEHEALEADLDAERRSPAPAFRGDLARHLSAEGAPPARPARLWLWAGASGAAGMALLLAALAGVPN
jgi:hypothetical protein